MNPSIKSNLLYLTLGALLTITTKTLYKILKSQTTNKQHPKTTLLQCIGNTPLIYLPKLSEALHCEIFAKVEFMNPFGSSKDRAVLHMLRKAEFEGYFEGNREVVQASSGSTAITLVQICKIMGLLPTIFLTDDLSEDKYTYLQTLGANIIKVPQVSIVDSNHFFNKARDYAKQKGAFFMNQFENLNNTEVHYNFTGPEIYQQMQGNIDAFVCSAGTGGTIAGISRYLKEKDESIDIVLADPQGSGLFNKIKYNVLFTFQEKEGHRLKNPFDTVIEGIGLTRPTKNFEQALIDDAYKVTDIQALHLSHYLIQNQGLFVGGSCSVNLAAVIKYCRKNPGSRIVTILHDSGNRYLRKFYSQQYLQSKNCKFLQLSNYPPQNLDFIK